MKPISRAPDAAATNGAAKAAVADGGMDTMEDEHGQR